MKHFPLLAISLAALTLSACEYKKHPMDKPPPSAMAERDSAPKFDDLDKEESKAGVSGDAMTTAPGPSTAGARTEPPGTGAPGATTTAPGPSTAGARTEPPGTGAPGAMTTAPQ
jgi:hypothetical protein